MHLVRVTSRTREVSTEMSAVCARNRIGTVLASASGRSAQPAASRGGDQCETRD
jgi:hypothetical protein